jgi:hypothetical protein
MKSKLLISLLLSIGFISSCNEVKQPTTVDNNPSVLVSPKFNTPVFDSKKSQGLVMDFSAKDFNITGKVFDANTKKVLEKEIILTIEGENKDKVENATYNFKTGDIQFKLKEGINPSESNPIKLLLVAKADGYISSSISLNIKSNKTSFFSIDLVDLKQPPKGVTTFEKTGITVNNGTLKTSFSADLKSNQTDATMSLKLSEGTVLRDSSGSNLSGNIKADVAFFDNQSPQILTTFPGGLDNANININGLNREGYFMTGGFTSIELTDSTGKKASTFDKPMEITMQIPKTTINPETGKEIKEGDKIGLWSYNPENGKWESEKDVIIGALGSNGNYTAKYSVSHLSYWNLDWFSSSRCNPKLRLSWKNGIPVPVQVEAKFEGQYWSYPNTLKDEVNDLYNVPNDRDVTFTAKFSGKEVGKVTTKLGTECKDINLTINSDSLPQMRDIPVYIGLRSKTEFTLSELESLMLRFNVGSEQKAIILNHIKENNLVEPYKIDNNLIDELEKKGAKNLRELKMFLDQVIRPDTYLYDYVSNPYSYKSYAVKAGKTSIRVFDGEEHVLNVNLYYKGKYYQFNKTISIDSNVKEIILDKVDTDLTISAVKDYLEKSGLKINSLVINN